MFGHQVWTSDTFVDLWSLDFNKLPEKDTLVSKQVGTATKREVCFVICFIVL